MSFTSQYSEANKQWAVYAEQLKSENINDRKSASAEDIRMSSERTLKEVDTNKHLATATRKSEGDLENSSSMSPSSDTRHIENLRNKVSLLTQQVFLKILISALCTLVAYSSRFLFPAFVRLQTSRSGGM